MSSSPAYRDGLGRWHSEGRRKFGLVPWTRVKLAAALGISHQAVSQLVSGKTRRPQYEVAVRIEEIFQIAPREWLRAPSDFASGACERSDESSPMVDVTAGEHAAE